MENKTENMKTSIILLLLNMRMIRAKIETEGSRCVVAEDVITCLLLRVLFSWVGWPKL